MDFLNLLLLIFILMLLVFLFFSGIFWIWMIISAIRNRYENKAMWIVLLWLGALPAAVAYYFAVHRKLKKEKEQAQTQSVSPS